VRSRAEVGEVVEEVALGDDRRAPGALAVLGIGAADADELGLRRDVALDEVDAIGVVDGNVDDGHAAVDALGDERALMR
jgi:hypothetical protein